MGDLLVKSYRFLKSLRSTLVILFFTLGLAACGGGSSGSGNSGPTKDNNNGNNTALHGVAQKGPLQQGGTVTLKPLDTNGNPSGGSVSATLDDLGGYSIALDTISWQGPTLITDRGPYFNEMTGVYENTLINTNGLQAVVDSPSEATANINLFTHLVAARTRHLMQHESKLFGAARDQARDELATLLAAGGTDAWPIPVSDDFAPTLLNLLDRETTQLLDYPWAEQDSISLLLFSSTLLTALDSPDWDSLPSGANGTSSNEGINKATEDFSDNGEMDGDGKNLLGNMKKAAEDTIGQLDKAKKHLKEKFKKLPPLFEVTYIDKQDAIDALKEVLEDRYLEPALDSGRTLDDYIDVNVSNGSVQVSVNLDQNGHLLPNEQWYIDPVNADFCPRQVRYPAEVAEKLNFKMVRNTETVDGVTRDQYFVFAQVLNTETGGIQAQKEGDTSVMYDAGLPPDQVSLVRGMERALDGLTYKNSNVSAEPKEPATDVCGDIRLVHVSGNKVGDDVTFMTGFDGVDSPGLS